MEAVMADRKCVLVTGVTGKAGQAFLRGLFDDPGFSDFSARALLHSRDLEPHERNVLSYHFPIEFPPQS
jgi:hypothetical protein